jgi:hypothetical protein
MKNAILVGSVFLLSACLENELPLCDDQDTKTVIADVINKALFELQRSPDDKTGLQNLYNDFANKNISFVEAKNIREVGFNEERQMRICKANIILSNGEDEKIDYRITWDNRKKGIFEVEIIDNN